MSMTVAEKNAVKKSIADSLRAKFRNYAPRQKTAMPFHTRLLGKDRMALFSFIQSLNTTFGVSVYEPVACALARGNFRQVTRGQKLGDKIAKGAATVIGDIMSNLTTGKEFPNQSRETEKIRAICGQGETVPVKLRQADIYLVAADGAITVIDIKTAKPNIDGFEKYKQTLLQWTAAVQTMLAIPYNPDHPKPYQHWTMGAMLERGAQIKVAEEFWDFLAGKPVYEDLLQCFEETGIEMRDEIDRYFAKFR